MPPVFDREQTRERSAAVPHYLYEGGGGERLPPPELPFMFTSVQVRRRGGAGGREGETKATWCHADLVCFPPLTV